MNPFTKILIIDNDKDLSEALTFQLSLNEKYQTVEAGDETIALTQINNNIFDLVIINSRSSDLDSQNLAIKLRSINVKCPIIMLVSNKRYLDTHENVKTDLNKYILKPFKYSLLLKSIETQLHSYKKAEETEFSLGKYIFKPNSKTLEIEGNNPILLTEKETDILKFLYKNLENVVSRETLLHEVWGYNFNVTTHTLETHIYRLRQKIETDPSNATFLKTETGGYQLHN
ncbi:response regulator transcription factor [Amylibacter sp.]|nr:response regulator transcription factor [Amylibacter sp.]MDB4079349.1 response regulator transcription factor [Amylibacter sp.]